MKGFKDWYTNKVRVSGYPMVDEISGKISSGNKNLQDYEVIINVSDEAYLNYSKSIQELGKQYFWFPMGENQKDMGMSSIFGALWIAFQSFESNKKVLIHCHAGINRSRTIADALYFLGTDSHINEECRMILWNCGQHLPKREIFEKWLHACRRAFLEPERFIGGMYDWTLREAGIE